MGDVCEHRVFILGILDLLDNLHVLKVPPPRSSLVPSQGHSLTGLVGSRAKGPGV
jgi:hypothetical protein